MKVNKTQAILYMYELLLIKGSFSKQEIMSTIEINNLTFLRYVQELRAYLMNFYKPSEIVFSSKTSRYYITSFSDK